MVSSTRFFEVHEQPILKLLFLKTFELKARQSELGKGKLFEKCSLFQQFSQNKFKLVQIWLSHLVSSKKYAKRSRC